MTKSAGQVVISFGADELDIHDKLRVIAKESRVPISALVKTALRAALDEDENELAKLKVYRSFSPALLLAGPVEA